MVTVKQVEKGYRAKNGEMRMGNYYRISIFGEQLETIPVLLERKKCHARLQKKRANCLSFQVEPLGEGDYNGFELDGNGRFLLGDFTVTHNSTAAKDLEKHGWHRVNQDDLGTADECKKLMDKHLKHGEPVIIDRCNVHPKERKMWVNEAKKYTTNVDCLFMNTPIDECKRRAKERKNHPTLDIDKVDEVIDEFSRGLQEPKGYEGPYANVYIVSTPDEAKQILKSLYLDQDEKPKKK